MNVTEKNRYISHLADGFFSVCAECSIIGLVIFDILVITAELMIDLDLIRDPNESPVDNPAPTTTGPSQVTENSTSNHHFDPGGLSKDFGINNGSDNLTLADGIIHYTGLLIASLFIVEMLFKFIVKPTFWKGNKFQVFDVGIVIVLFSLEVIFSSVDIPYVSLEALTYIVILRLWRVPFVCNRKVEALSEEMRADIAFVEALRLKESESNKKLEKTVEAQQEEIDRLKRCIAEHDKDEDSEHTHQDAPDVVTMTTEDDTLKVCAQKTVNSVLRNAASKVFGNDNDVPDSPDHKHSNGSVPNKHCEKSETVHYPGRLYARSGSESSLDDNLATSCQVEVEIEDVKNRYLRSTSATSEDTSETVDMETKEVYSYDNSAYEGDDTPDDGTDKKEDWQLVADTDGTKTYRRADGIPMTSL